MRRLIVILYMAAALLSSCGVVKQSGVSSTRGIPSTFFNCALGSTPSFVNFTMNRQYYYGNRGGASRYKLLPLGKRQIKSGMTYDGVPYGGYTWQEASFLFDYRDRFFCMAFMQEFSNPDYARLRFNDIKSTLDTKYGIGEAIQYGVRYGNPQGKCIILSIVPIPKKEGEVCCLYYMDEKIYQTSTAAATEEL